MNKPNKKFRRFRRPEKKLKQQTFTVIKTFNWFEKTFTILATAVTLWLGIITLSLQKQANKLAQDSTMQQKQIDALTEMIKEAKVQSQLDKEQISQLKSLSSKSIEQFVITNNQLDINRKLLTISSQEALLFKKQNLEKFITTYWKVERLRLAKHGYESLNEMDKKSKINYLSKAISLMDSELTNPFLYSDDSLYRYWKDVIDRGKICFHNYNLKAEDIRSLNKNSPIDSSQKVKDEEMYFRGYVKSYSSMSNYFFKKYIFYSGRGFYDAYYYNEQ